MERRRSETIQIRPISGYTSTGYLEFGMPSAVSTPYYSILVELRVRSRRGTSQLAQPRSLIDWNNS